MKPIVNLVVIGSSIGLYLNDSYITSFDEGSDNSTSEESVRDTANSLATYHQTVVKEQVLEMEDDWEWSDVEKYLVTNQPQPLLSVLMSDGMPHGVVTNDPSLEGLQCILIDFDILDDVDAPEPVTVKRRGDEADKAYISHLTVTGTEILLDDLYQKL